MRAVICAAAAVLLLSSITLNVDARVNVTGAVETFLITNCEECTRDQDSIFCTEGDDGNYVSNMTTKVTIKQKKARFGAADGAKYCWEGTFGRLLNEKGKFDEILGSKNITASLTCQTRQLFYRQCVLPAEMTIILMAIASIICVCVTTCSCFYCGCCKCCNNPDDKSRWGMCNRFCPWAPCADPPEKEIEISSNLVNPSSEDDNKASLFGRNPALKAIEASRAGSLSSDIRKPTSPAKSATAV